MTQNKTLNIKVARSPEREHDKDSEAKSQNPFILGVSAPDLQPYQIYICTLTPAPYQLYPYICP
eukprot:313980-Amphidinium_carterae.2